MATPFMNTMATGLACQGFRVARFEFPYMAARRMGRRQGPDPERILTETWLAAIKSLGAANLTIGGKSMGGRIASMVADQACVAALVCLGYPFHPVGKPDRLRVEHLRRIRTTTLILQGTRDPFGGRDEVAGYELSPAIRLNWLEDGDHSFKPRKTSGRTEQDNLNQAIDTIVAFLNALGRDG
jgi:predicted alpha/beta-hydrolase family hydrolase